MSNVDLAPQSVKVIPRIHAYEGTRLLVDFKDYIANPDGSTNDLNFSYWTLDGIAFPRGLQLSGDGVLTGIAPTGSTSGEHSRFKLMVNNNADQPSVFVIEIVILEQPVVGGGLVDNAQLSEFLSDAHNEFNERQDVEGSRLADPQQKINQEKQSVWQAVLQELDLPNTQNLADRPITYADVYYLISRFAYFSIWNADDLAMPSGLAPLDIKGCSDKFNVYDRGSCLVAVPKNLYDHSRGLMDAINTAKSIASEVYRRGWNVEFGGFDKMVSAAWVELNCLQETLSKGVSIHHYDPSSQDQLLLQQARTLNVS